MNGGGGWKWNSSVRVKGQSSVSTSRSPTHHVSSSLSWESSRLALPVSRSRLSRYAWIVSIVSRDYNMLYDWLLVSATTILWCLSPFASRKWCHSAVFCPCVIWIQYSKKCFLIALTNAESRIKNKVSRRH